jgi:hypothetical protein
LVRAPFVFALFAALALCSRATAQLPGPPGPDVVQGPPRDVRVRLEWGPPDGQSRNAVSAGFGTVVGFFGVRYARFLAPTPLVAWAGAGGMAGGIGLELTLPRLVIGDPARGPLGDWDTYLSIGALQDWDGGPPYAGSLVFEIGARHWYGRRDLFSDFAIGARREMWGTPTPGGALAIRVLLAKAF